MNHAECVESVERKLEAYSNKENTEMANEVVLNVRLKWGTHVYRSNFAVANLPL